MVRGKDNPGVTYPMKLFFMNFAGSVVLTIYSD